VLGVSGGRLVFTSGATEGIQTAVLSALHALRQRRNSGQLIPTTLLYGATEHKAVPEALKHWNALLGLSLQIEAIPVGTDGKHDLSWLSRHLADAALVCTMAANNETGVVSDLDGIAATLGHSPALWLVDGVQALGKLPLRLSERRIDYVPFSGHKLYAPKGVGMLYVREGAPFTPLLAGGGQEDAQRGGTENVAGIAALGAVLEALEAGGVFVPEATLFEHRARLAAALQEAFPGIVFNAPFDNSLPTTLNVSLPGVEASTLIDLFDAAGLRVSGGSACSAALAQPSYVLKAMGLPVWQAASAVRLSFGLADTTALVDEACARLHACGKAVTANPVEMTGSAVRQALAGRPQPLVIDVREAGECSLQPATDLKAEAVPLSSLPDLLPRWRDLPADTSVIFVCLTGKRSAQAANALRRYGHANAWSLAGGLALWTRDNVAASSLPN
jgi:cysteine sulfinate desulfinase/cysteine desulfurase-like protein/rhodanese-related sulfurtransferase